MTASPASWARSCLTVTRSLPIAANSGHYAATGSSSRNNPLECATAIAAADMPFVVENTGTTVSASHLRARRRSLQPAPQVDDVPAIDVDRDRCADLAALAEVGSKRICDPAETLGHAATDPLLLRRSRANTLHTSGMSRKAPELPGKY